MDTVTLADIEAAARVLEKQIERTAFRHSRTLSAITGAEVWLKFENRQYTASFKERGALNRLASLTPAERRRGVIAMSAGNHAQGVAYHAGRLGIPATIVMPLATPFVKVRDTKRFGARVVLHGTTLAEAAAEANRLQAAERLVFVHPYDDAKIIAGQGTIGLEMLREVPELDMLVVPVGGGGLISGVATAAKALKPAIKVIGVESEGYSAMHQMLRGQPVDVGGSTIAEGIAVRDIGALPLSIARNLVDEVVLVSERRIERAVAMLLQIEKTVAEGSGAAGLAAMLAHPVLFQGHKVGTILCGGNIDDRLLSQILLRELVRSGRMVRLQVVLSDVPGALAEVAGIVGRSGGNIVEVHHQRVYGAVAAKSAELLLEIETRDRAHIGEIQAALEQAGFPARALDETA